MKVLRGTMLSLAMLCSLAAAAASVTITKALQRYPWNDKIDIDWSVTCDTSHVYGLKFLFIDGATTNTVTDSSFSIKPSDNITSTNGLTTIDISTQATDFDEKLKTGGIQIMAVLIEKGGLDSGDGVTFVPGDYLVLDLSTGAVTAWNNVTSASLYNKDEYKTTKMLFRHVPAGSFMMQATDSVNLAGTSGTQVMITNDYYIAVFPCTQKQYVTVTGGTVPSGQTATGDMIPVAHVTWNMIAGTTSSAFVTNLNSKMSASGYKVALPNEAQWERAARAGSTTEWFFGASDSSLGTYAWYQNVNYTLGVAQAVGEKSPNAWGLYDMYGNVWEWCTDWYADTITYSQQPGGPSDGYYRVLRGGASGNGASWCSSVYRYNFNPASTDLGLGFRLIITLK